MTDKSVALFVAFIKQSIEFIIRDRRKRGKNFISSVAAATSRLLLNMMAFDGPGFSQEQTQALVTEVSRKMSSKPM